MATSDTYVVGREKIREYASSIGETAAICHDVEAARAAGFADVVAPPMFACVYSWAALAPVVLDPEVGVDFSRPVHGGQEFPWQQTLGPGAPDNIGAPLKENAEGGRAG